MCYFLADGNMQLGDGNALSWMVTGNPHTAVTINCISVAMPLPPDGAQASATVYTLMETAKANGLNPEKYISHLLTVLPERFAHDPKAQIDDLLPWTDGLHDLCHV